MTSVRPGDDWLRGLALGLLEPGDALALRDRIASDPVLALRFQGVQLEATGLAPLGLGTGATLGVRWATVLRAAPPRQGDRIVLQVHGPPESWPLVLVDGHALAPRSPAELTPLASFRQAGDGWELDLVLPPDPQDSSWILVLVPPDRPVDWTAPEPSRWRDLLEAAAQGDVPAWRFSVSAPPGR